MVKAVQNAKEVKELYRKSCPESEVYEENEKERNQHMVEFIRTINFSIQPLHLEIKKGICETSSTHFYCLISNGVENATTRLATDYSINDLEFFKKLIENIVQSDSGSLGSRSALNIVERLEKKMSKSEAEGLLGRLQDEQWIVMKEGNILLAVRSILELNQYILQLYPDAVKICNICSLICLNGSSCLECGVRIHHHCARRLYHNKDNPTCPDQDCGAPWSHNQTGHPSDQ